MCINFTALSLNFPECPHKVKPYESDCWHPEVPPPQLVVSDLHHYCFSAVRDS